MTKIKFLLVGAMVAAISLVVVGTAGAVPPTVPAVPVATYGDSLLTGLGSAVADVFPYAAAITAFAIGVGLVRRWLGAKKATRV
jgi:uncharacterized protein YqgC (DUF456 family)